MLLLNTFIRLHKIFEELIERFQLRSFCDDVCIVRNFIGLLIISGLCGVLNEESNNGASLMQSTGLRDCYKRLQAPKLT